ncbi:MAG: MFS transporter [Betaproteobacteria bacterium]|nr:MFS transporter [Betaproteobacteria bacterium]
MTRAELRASIGLAGIFGLRLLGLFIILPVFALYAEHLPGGDSHTLVGVALGAYGLTQAILQIPFGWLSDRHGRKPVIYWGLVLFAIGSFVAATGHDIYMVILGRVIQGAGAISAAVMALAADLTREEHRTKAMAMIGMTIGATFFLSLVLAPLLNRVIGVPGIFVLTGLLALAAIGIVRWFVPDARESHFHSDAEPKPGQFMDVLQDRELIRLNYGVFALHAVLMALWMVVPFGLRKAGLAADHHWQVYLPVMAVSVILMVPAIVYGEKTGRMKPVFAGAVAVLVVSELMLEALGDSLTGLTAGLLVFFTAFNLLEASLPSLISKIAPVGAKGTAIGVYSSIQFLGTFVGAAVGGYLYGRGGASAVFAFCAVLTFLWLVLAATMKAPAAVRTRMYHIPEMDADRASGLSRELATLPGVREALVLAEEGVAYLKVDMRGFDEQHVIKLIGGEA